MEWGSTHVSDGTKTRITVNIYGQQYTIMGDEPNSHVRMVASIVDENMKQLKEKNPHLDLNKLAVLTAVNAVNDYLLLKQEYDKLTEKMMKEEERS